MSRLAPGPGLTAASRSQPSRPTPVYRHSVIPGGVHQSEELTSALSRDQYASVHYANFDAKNAYIVHVKAPRMVHVSYRMGKNIYWTKKKVRIAPGETLLTDGKSFVRTRCGNRISETPQAMVSDKEPAPEVLDTIIPPAGEGLERTGKSSNDAGPLAGPVNGLNSPDNFGPPTGGPGSGGFPPPSTPFPPPPVVSVPEGPPKEVPEPGSLALVMFALISLILIRQRSRRNG